MHTTDVLVQRQFDVAQVTTAVCFRLHGKLDLSLGIRGSPATPGRSVLLMLSSMDVAFGAWLAHDVAE